MLVITWAPLGRLKMTLFYLVVFAAFCLVTAWSRLLTTRDQL
jgi:hypothetical protein